MYHFRTRKDDGEFKTDLNIHVIPVKAGRSRVIFSSLAYNYVPVWFQHAASNRFLNTDSWLHDAERVMRQKSGGNQNYLFASESDGGVQGFRRWWSKYGARNSPPNTFGPAAKEALTKLDRRQQIDPWEFHSRHCVSCRNALKVMKRVEFAGLVMTVFSALVLRHKPIVASLLAAAGLYVRHLSQQCQTVIEGNPSPSGIADRSPAHQQDYQKMLLERRVFTRKLSKGIKEQDARV
jgi:Pheophorbide a oxygenase